MRHFKYKQCESDIVIVQYLTTIARILLVFPTALDSLLPYVFQQEDVFKMYYDMFHL